MTTFGEYAPLTEVDPFSTFCREHCVQSIDLFDGQPLDLEPWQFSLMEEALAATDERPTPYWSSVAIVLPRKNGKTTLLAAYALYALLFRQGQPEILLCAASDRQAGRLFDAVVSFVRRDPWLAAQVVVREWHGEVSRTDGGGKILRMSSSPERLHGYNPSLVVCDEVAQWTTPNLRRAWAALTTAGGARRLTQTFTISTAGQAHEREDGILGRLIDTNERIGETESRGALTVSRNHAARTLVFNHSAPTVERDDHDAIKLANPASWITTDYLRRQAANPELAASDYLQYHGCVWSVAEDIWLAPQQWDEIEREDEPILSGEMVALGFDGSRHLDATALVACRIEDGQLAVLDAWERPEGAAGRGWEIPAVEVEAAIEDAFDRYRVIRFYPDPPYWQTEIASWAHRFGDSVVIPWSTNRMRQMSAAVERFRTDAIAGKLGHDGSSLLRRHVLSAHMRKVRTGYWIEKASSNSPDKIDAAVASVLAYEARNDAIAAGIGRRVSKVPVSL
jgi:phage terminase large subunit-like protein